MLIVSTELDEVIALADRIAVLYKGKLVGIVPAGTGRDVLGLMMAGLSPQDAHADTASKNPARGSRSGRRRRRRNHRIEPGARRPPRAGAQLRRCRRRP